MTADMVQESHRQSSPSGDRLARQMAAPQAPEGNPLLALQRSVGNQAVQRQLRQGSLSPRLIVGQQHTLGNQAVQRLLRSQTAQATGDETAENPVAHPAPLARPVGIEGEDSEPSLSAPMGVDEQPQAGPAADEVQSGLMAAPAEPMAAAA